MYLVVTYDCREEKARGRVRRLLRKYSFTMLAYSVYVGRGSKALSERIASRISKLLGPADRATIIALSDFQYEFLLEVTKGSVSLRGERVPVLVFYGRGGKKGASHEDPRRPGGVPPESEAKSASTSSDGLHSA